MTNTLDKSEMLPCPFPHEVKRGVFVEVDTVDFGFARVSCSDCGCAGPYVTLANHERATKAEKAEAIAAWNTRAHDGDGWRDIESAPKDGTKLILLNARQGNVAAVAWWSRVGSKWNATGGVSFHQPTHWRPLPEPPALKASGEE